VRAFGCPRCGAELYFDNSVCLTCGSAVGYARAQRAFVLVSPAAPVCAGLDTCGCNWIGEPVWCRSCRLTRTRPADGDLAGLQQYWVAEAAKRRLVFGLEELELPVRVSDGSGGLAFDLLSSSAGPVTTGYLDGVITLDLAESDDAHREGLRRAMDEPYRTVLGHLRHEVGHYYGEILALAPQRRPQFQALFGNERASYGAALERHYAVGAPLGWRESFVSAYASMHPLEDFAEVFAHFLHIADTLQTAAAFGVLPPTGLPVHDPRALAAASTAEVVATAWIPLAKALNQINRSMGKPDLYPFVLGPAVIAKLAFVAGLVADAAA
jgi:hypothetical protein